MKKYGNWIKFNKLTKREKTLRIINIIFAIAMFLTTVGLLIFYSMTGDKDNRIITCVTMMVIYPLPFLYELIFRRRLGNVITFLYLLYALIAGLIGCCFNVYYLQSWYDIFVHILAGYTFAWVGIFILSRLENYKKLKILTIVVFCFIFTLAFELVWELFEWTADNLFHQTMQGAKLPGENAPLVTDTDLDLLCNLSGGIIFIIHFLIGKLTKCSLGVKFMEKELIPNNKIKEVDSENVELETEVQTNQEILNEVQNLKEKIDNDCEEKDSQKEDKELKE